MVKQSGTHHAAKSIHDACYRRVKAQYDIFPSARASQAIAKCRKESGHVRHSERGNNLRRWQRESWKTTDNKPCGSGGVQYCRPTKKVTKKTPKLKSSLSKSQQTRKLNEKKQTGMGHRVSKA